MGVSESSLKRWVDRGLIRAEKTTGGHRRVGLSAILNYARVSGQNFTNPDVLDLPEDLGATPANIDLASREFAAALKNDSCAVARRVVLDLYLSGFPISTIFDTVLTPGIESIGQLWRQKKITVGVERNANTICSRILDELGGVIFAEHDSGRTAFSGTWYVHQAWAEMVGHATRQRSLRVDASPGPAETCVLTIDYVKLAEKMGELVLRDCGWHVSSVGTFDSFDKLFKAMDRERPQLTWLSVPSIPDHDRFKASFNVLFETATLFGTNLVLGGQVVATDIRRLHGNVLYGDCFHTLECISKNLFSKNDCTHS